MRQFVDEYHVVGDPPLRGLSAVEIEYRLARQRSALFANDEQERTLVPLRMTYADYGGLGHIGMSDGDIFELDRADPFAARLDHVLRPIGDLQIAVGVERADVACR